MKKPVYVQSELQDTKTNSPLPRQGNALLENLLNEGIRFILLKGEPGTGKTTLALDLLKKHGKGAYVTTRVSLEQLQTHKPELRNLLSRKASSAPETSDHKKLLFEDLRLSSVEDILQAIIEESEKMGPESLIVLDSWDALAKKLDMTERMKVEQSLLAIAEASRAKILFVSEEIALGTSDYFVDAVVQLEDDVHHGHRLRRLVWKKLRGSEISQRSFLYTLKGGKFTILENTKVLWPEEYQSGTFKPIKHGSIRYSTGSEDLDRFLGGGFRRGSSILLELDNQIGSNWHAPLVQSIERNFLGNDCAAVVIPTDNRTPGFVKGELARYFSEDVLRSGLRVISGQKYEEDPCFLNIDPSLRQKGSELIANEVKILKGGKNRPVFYFIGIDTVESMFGSEDLNALGLSLGQSMRHTGDLSVAAIKTGSSLLNQLTSASDMHLKLEEADGTMIMHSKKPPSELYQVEYDYSPGFPNVILQPIV